MLHWTFHVVCTFLGETFFNAILAPKFSLPKDDANCGIPTVRGPQQNTPDVSPDLQKGCFFQPLIFLLVPAAGGSRLSVPESERQLLLADVHTKMAEKLRGQTDGGREGGKEGSRQDHTHTVPELATPGPSSSPSKPSSNGKQKTHPRSAGKPKAATSEPGEAQRKPVGGERRPGPLLAPAVGSCVKLGQRFSQHPPNFLQAF